MRSPACSSLPLALQIMLLLLTLRKFLSALRHGWARQSPILALIARDGTWAFVVTTGEPLIFSARVPC